MFAAMRTLTLAFVFVVLNAIGCAGGGGDDGGGTPDAPSSNIPVCGDGTCAAAEVGHCAMDCGQSTGPQCGNSMCEAGESTTNCPSDCAAAGPVCGDGTCDMAGGENSTNCPGDCGGGGGGTLDCNDQNVLLGCFTCLLDDTTCVPPMTAEACATCLGGP